MKTYQEAEMLLTAIRTVVNADLSYERSEDRVLSVIRHTLTARFVSTQQDPYIYHVHTSWWQMFKDAYAPRWFKRFWPVKKHEHRIDVKLLYPHLRSELPRDIMGDRVCLALMAEDRMRFSMFDPDGPIDVQDYARMAKADLLSNGTKPKCKCCGRLIHL